MSPGRRVAVLPMTLAVPTSPRHSGHQVGA